MGSPAFRQLWVVLALSAGCDGQLPVQMDTGTDAGLDTANDILSGDSSHEVSIADAADGSESGPRGCFTDEVLCSGSCTHLRTDVNHCGRCGLACEAGQFCSGGQCLDVCPDATVTCGGACVNALSDPRNCGACGVTCREEQSCNGGVCACPLGTEACGSRCVDTLNSVDNCGTCGNVCAAGQVCVNGDCAAQCPATICGEPDCLRRANPVEIAITPCDGACVSLPGSSHHCGACGVRCEGGTFCEFGECVCRSDQALCGGSCVNLSNDVQNCGDCGVVCDVSSVCFESECVSSCPRGVQPCGGSCVDVNTDVRNCGACGVTCAGCVDGVCVEAVELALGEGFSCARMSDGSVSCWGSNSGFFLGHPDLEFSFAPVAVEGVLGASSIAASAGHVCAIVESASEVWCWGLNGDLQLGRPGVEREGLPEPVTALPKDQLWTRVALGTAHSCVLSNIGEVWCWGSDSAGQLGDGASSPPAGTAVQVVLPRPATELVAGNQASFVILNDGTLYGWGDNFGDVFVDPQTIIETPVSLGLSGVLEVAAGGSRLCYRTAAGMDCRGMFRDDSSGGATAVEVPADSFSLSDAFGIRQIRMGAQQTLLLRDSLVVDAVGYNFFGQFGTGNVVPSPSAPVRIQGLSNVTQLGASDTHSCAIAHGQVACWGSNSSGQVGLNVNQLVLTPVAVVF